MTHDLLLEIGTEEIPSSFLPRTLDEMRERAETLLGTLRLAHGRLDVLGTPRRLCLWVGGLEEAQEDLVREVSGPPRNVAFDETGEPTKALEKFCARYGAKPEETSIVQKGKREYVSLSCVEKGRTAQDLLTEHLPSWILSLSFPKSMRWGDEEVRFARPIRWLLALYGQTPLEIEVGDVRSASFTRGHRFLGSTEPIGVDDPAAYRDTLSRNGVILDPAERRVRICEQAASLAESVGGRIVDDAGLVDTLVFITEYPVCVRGTFEARYLSLPREVLIATMRDHQKYFSLQEKTGDRLLPYFITVANLDADDMSRIQAGNEKVLRARLEDARFFFEEDRRVPLEERVDALKQVIFHERLGTAYDKVGRIERLASCLAREVCPDQVSEVRRAAHLCKADLVSQMVGEFPELQGIMGGIYAAEGGESPVVSQAVREHYMPVSAEGDLPTGRAGAVVSIADKLDTIVGFFGVGARVTGNADPFALRRRAIGILRVLLDQGLDVSLPWLVRQSRDVLCPGEAGEAGEIVDEVLAFFRTRCHQYLLGRGFPHDTIDSVMSRTFESMPDLYRRIEALHRMRANEDFEKLILGCKRTVNILRQAGEELGYAGCATPLSAEDLREDAERDLFEGVRLLRDQIAGRMERSEYEGVLQDLVRLKDPVDRLFDSVMILVEDERVRQARLHLLHGVAELFQGFADFSKISL